MSKSSKKQKIKQLYTWYTQELKFGKGIHNKKNNRDGNLQNKK